MCQPIARFDSELFRCSRTLIGLFGSKIAYLVPFRVRWFSIWNNRPFLGKCDFCQIMSIYCIYSHIITFRAGSLEIEGEV